MWERNGRAWHDRLVDNERGVSRSQMGRSARLARFISVPTAGPPRVVPSSQLVYSAPVVPLTLTSSHSLLLVSPFPPSQRSALQQIFYLLN